MTNKKDEEVIEVDGAKGVTPKNVVVQVSKDEAEKIEKIKKALKTKKGTTTRFINKLEEQVVKFKTATETSNNDNTRTIGYSKKLKFWSWTLVTQGIFVMTLLDNLSQKFAQKKHIFPSLIAKSFYKGI